MKAQAISFSCSLAILLVPVLGSGGAQIILWNPISWFFGGILLLFLSSFFYLVYCAVCHLWFPKREPGYPFERTQNDETFRYSQYGNPYDRTQNFEEELFDDILEDDIFENDDGPSQIDKDKLVRARLERFHLSEDEAELIFGKYWRDKLGEEHWKLFYTILKIQTDLMYEKKYSNKVFHIIDKVIQIIDSVYNEDPKLAKSWESNPGSRCTGTFSYSFAGSSSYSWNEEWEFFKKHKKTKLEFELFGADISEFYEVLGLGIPSTFEQVRKRWRELALKWHPDRNKTGKEQAAKKFAKINEAYEKIIENMRAEECTP